MLYVSLFCILSVLNSGLFFMRWHLEMIVWNNWKGVFVCWKWIILFLQNMVFREHWEEFFEVLFNYFEGVKNCSLIFIKIIFNSYYNFYLQTFFKFNFFFKFPSVNFFSLCTQFILHLFTYISFYSFIFFQFFYLSLNLSSSHRFYSFVQP